MCSGVMPPSRVVARMFAPADSSICVSAASPFDRRPVQRRHAVALRGVDVGAVLQQRPHRYRIARLGGIGDISAGRA